MKKLFLLCSLILLPVFLVSAKDSNVEAYVSNLLDESILVLEDKSLNNEVKLERIRKTLLNHLDTKWMAKYTLGRSVKNVPKAKLEKFVQIYTKYLVTTYSNSLIEYKGQKVEIKSYDTLSEKFYIVKTHVLGSGDNPIHVDYLTKKTSGNHYKVRDIITEGISLVNSQRSEYTNVIENDGIDHLIDVLVKKTSGSK